MASRASILTRKDNCCFHWPLLVLVPDEHWPSRYVRRCSSTLLTMMARSLQGLPCVFEEDDTTSTSTKLSHSCPILGSQGFRSSCSAFQFTWIVPSQGNRRPQKHWVLTDSCPTPHRSRLPFFLLSQRFIPNT